MVGNVLQLEIWRKQKLVSEDKVEENKQYERFASFQITLIVLNQKNKKQANEKRQTRNQGNGCTSVKDEANEVTDRQRPNTM